MRDRGLLKRTIRRWKSIGAGQLREKRKGKEVWSFSERTKGYPQPDATILTFDNPETWGEGGPIVGCFEKVTDIIFYLCYVYGPNTFQEHSLDSETEVSLEELQEMGMGFVAAWVDTKTLDFPAFRDFVWKFSGAHELHVYESAADFCEANIDLLEPFVGGEVQGEDNPELSAFLTLYRRKEKDGFLHFYKL